MYIITFLKVAYIKQECTWKPLTKIVPKPTVKILCKTCPINIPCLFGLIKKDLFEVICLNNFATEKNDAQRRTSFQREIILWRWVKRYLKFVHKTLKIIHFIKFAADTNVLGLISNSDETKDRVRWTTWSCGSRTTISAWTWTRWINLLWTSGNHTPKGTPFTIKGWNTETHTSNTAALASKPNKSYTFPHKLKTAPTTHTFY